MEEKKVLEVLNEGSVEEMEKLAEALEYIGGDRNIRNAALLLYRADLKGSKYAKKVFGFTFSRKAEVNTSPNRMQLLEQAALLGNKDAEFSVACRYRKGIGVEKNYEKAMFWYQRAFKAGHAESGYYLGMMYEKGKGVEKDHIKALQMIMRASFDGCDEATLHMARLYESGDQLFPKNEERAFAYYLETAKQGNKTAFYRLGEMYRDGIGVEVSGIRAVEWFKKSAQSGYIIAWYTLGQLYENGCGDIPPDFSIAEEYYREAIKNGYYITCHHYGQLYEEGKYLPKDMDAAIEQYTKSADEGYYPSLMRLYRIYSENPDYINRDLAEKMLRSMRNEHEDELRGQFPNLL